MTVNQSRTVALDTNKNLASQVDTTTVNGKAFTSTYNVAAKTITSVSPVGRQTVSTLDNKGRVVNVQAGNLAPTAYVYDSRGRLATVTVGTGTSARVTTFGYDTLDRLSSVTDPLLRVQSYTYDDANRVVGQVFTDGSQVGFSYDANGNVTSVTPPGRPEHDFGYTPADLMSSYTPPAVAGTSATTYEYNLDKQPLYIHRPDGSQIDFTYDSAGRLWTTTYPKGPSTSDGTITVTRSYNSTTGKLASASTSDGQTLSYGYDGNLFTSTTWSGAVSGSVSRTYNNDFRVASRTVAGSSVPFGYDNDGLLTSADGLTVTRDPTTGFVSATNMNTVADVQQYTPFGELQDSETKRSGATVFKETLVRDAAGRIEQKTETVQGTTNVYNYSYDSAGNLWQVLKNGILSATYLYDANGNRTSVTTAGGAKTATCDAQDRLLTYGNWTYTYTSNGELRTKTDATTGAVTRYSYDGAGNIRKVELADGRVVEYMIDPEGRRIAKKIDGVVVRRWTYRDALYPAAEYDGSGILLSYFVGTEFVVRGGSTFRVVKDHLGSPRLLVDVATGAVAQMLEYDEWGRVLSDSAPGWQPLGFASGIYDPDTGLVRFGRRDYDPDTGRWTTKDPVLFDGGQVNLYVYARNNPINNIDPNGLQCTFGEPISQAAAVGPLDAAKAKKLADEALTDAQMTDLPGAHNGQQDAFRHCYWSCRMAQELGADQAKKVGDTHEYCGGGPEGENSMDTSNNEAGRGLKDKGDCHDSCIAALNEGNLRTSPGGGQTPTYCPY